MPAFVLKLQDIDEAGRESSFPVEGSWLASVVEGSGLKVEPGSGPGRLNVVAQRTGSGILIRGTVLASLVGQCVRCLEEARLAVDTEITALLTPRETERHAGPEEVQLTAEDLTRDTYSGEQIVLDGLVREHILLECPMQLHCSEDCKGIEVPDQVRGGPEGAESVDPRLAPLLKIARELGQSEE